MSGPTREQVLAWAQKSGMSWTVQSEEDIGNAIRFAALAYVAGQESMHTELAARDLVIQKMREAARELRGLANHFDNMRIANVANEALALQSSTDALDAELAEAVAAEREACSQLLEEKSRRYTKDGTVGHIIAGCADAIRARGEQPTCKPK